MQMYYLSAGLLLGIMTIMDDSLELALGVHFATNFFAATLVGFEGASLQTDTLIKAREVDPYLMLISMAVGGAIFLWIAGRKYKWKSLIKIIEPIEYEKDNIQIST